MKTEYCRIPPESKLHDEKFDWFDAYRIRIADPDGKLTPWRVCEGFLDITPFWIKSLFGIRNLAVKLVGLSSDSLSIDETKARLREYETKSADEFPIDVGIAHGKIDSATDREIVAGAEDWHLDFRGSILIEGIPDSSDRFLTATTCVRFKHGFGRVYFLPVKPFHKLIVKSMLVRFARHWMRRESFGQEKEGR